MATEAIADPLLGDEGRVLGKGDGAWASFKREFAPTKSRVSVLVNVVSGSVPQAQRDLYREIEAWYPKGVQEIFEGVRREVEQDDVLKKWLPPEQIANRLQLIILDIRYPFPLPGKCVLTYRFDPNKPDWIVTIAEDYHVEWCGLGD